MRQTPLPLLAVVTGRPGSGKTTLASALAAEIRCPVLSRDRLKEGRLWTLGMEAGGDSDLARDVYETFFQVLGLLARSGVSHISEAAFQHKVWAPKLTPLVSVADIRIIVCDVSPEIARTRRQERARQDPQWSSFHPEPEGDAFERYDQPKLDVPTLIVDTAQDPTGCLLEILRFLR